jgi:hypothetical protein
MRCGQRLTGPGRPARLAAHSSQALLDQGILDQGILDQEEEERQSCPQNVSQPSRPASQQS